MRHSLIIAASLLLANSQVATAKENCAELGLPSDFLMKFYCKELHAIINENGVARGYGETTSSSSDPVEGRSWADVKALRDAYRADPSKTLELIKRIKSAGGLTED